VRNFWYFVEVTIPELYRNTVEGFPKTAVRHNISRSVILKSVKLDAIPDKKQIIVRAVVDGSKDNVYHPSIIFNDVHISNVPNHNKIIVRNRPLYYDMIDPAKHDVHIYCDCMDFVHMFSFANRNFLSGELLATQTSPRNPENLTGLCKHLISMKEYLEDQGIISRTRLGEAVEYLPFNSEEDGWELGRQAGLLMQDVGIHPNSTMELRMVVTDNDKVVAALYAGWNVGNHPQKRKSVHKFSADIGVSKDYSCELLIGPNLVKEAIKIFQYEREAYDDAILEFEVVNPKLAIYLKRAFKWNYMQNKFNSDFFYIY